MNNYFVEFHYTTEHASIFPCTTDSPEEAAAICERHNPGCIVTEVRLYEDPVYIN